MLNAILIKKLIYRVFILIINFSLYLILIQGVSTAAAQGVFKAEPRAPVQSVSSKETVRKYSTAQKRLLAINTAIFINTITQSRLDADSIQLVASQITGQPFLLPYSERIEGDNVSATGQLINQNNITAAKKLSKQLKGDDRIQSLVLLAIWYLHQPHAFQRDLDSAAYFVQEANKEILTGHFEKWHDESILITGEIEYQRGNIDKGRQLISSIFSSVATGNETGVMAAALLRLSKTFGSRDTVRLPYLLRAASVYRRLHLVENEIVARWLVADYYMTNNRALAEDNLKQVLALQRSTGFRHQLFTYYLLTAVLNNGSNYSEALKAAYAGLENMKWSGLYQFSGCFNMRVGVVYSGISNPALAISWFKKGTEIKSEETHFFWYKSFLYLTASLYQLGKPQESLTIIDSTVSKYPPKNIWESVQVLSTQGVCYDALHKKTLADVCYKKILTVVKKYQDPYNELSESYAEAALFYIRIGNTAMARSFLEKISQNLSNNNLDKVLKYNILYKIDSLESNYKAALKHHILFQQANDAMAAYDNQQQLDELTVKYATAKKDQDIQLLHKQRDAQQSELKKGKVIRNLMIAAGCLLVLLLVVVFNRYQLKQRTSAQITRKNTSLQHLLTEKEWLLKEVHHRVKNNLHTVICLLESQARYLENDALKAIQTSQHRIYAMSLIHQQLYQSDDIKTIDMATYIRQLVNSLEDGFGTVNQIRFDISIQPIALSLSHAIPLALIINEAVTNSIKYAFPQDKKGIITILMTEDESRIILVVADNGIGMKQIDHDAEPESLGLRLIKGLSEDIEAETTFAVDLGTRITLSFKPDPLNNPDAILESTMIKEGHYA